MSPTFRTAPRPDPAIAPSPRPVACRRARASTHRGIFAAACLAVLACLALAAPVQARNPGATDAAAQGLAAPGSEDAPRVRLAVAQANRNVALDEIVSGRARIGFTPVLERGVLARGKSGRVVWLRLRVAPGAAPAGAGESLVLPRQAIERLRLYDEGDLARPVAESAAATQPGSARWPGRYELPLADDGLAHTYYLAVEGRGWLDLQPVLMDAATAADQRLLSSRMFDLLYGALFVIGAVAVMRRAMRGARTLRVAAAAFACLGASLVGNQHLRLAIGGNDISSLPALSAALWVMASATLLWANAQYAGLEKNFPEVGDTLDRAGYALLAVAALLLLAPNSWLPAVQLFALGTLAATALAGAASLMFDHRHWRWVGALFWFVVLAGLVALVLASLQAIGDSMWVRRGFQLALALQLANFLLLPWARHALLRRNEARASRAPDLSAEQKIAQARDWMISSLQSGIQTGTDGDMEWIAYRRLMGGLKSVLPQTGAAVIAMNYHNEDLLLAEPKTSEPRFQMLLAQRASLLKNLSRSMGPQQVGLDFTGPDGPLQQVQLAVIPLPIERPGWGALLIERSPNVNYSDEELALCTEFAALATTAGDEAAEAMQRRRAQEIDGESGVYRAAMVDTLLQKAHALAQQKRRPLSVMRLAIDGYAELPEDLRGEALRIVADLVRDEIDYGESIGRAAADGFIVLLPGRPVGDARALGERLCAAMRKLGLEVAEGKDLGISIGVAQMHSTERLSAPMLERAERALGKARQYGGNQVQAIASTAP